MTDTENQTERAYGLATCPECGASFTRRSPVQVFHDRACQAAFHNLMSRRGRVGTALLQVWRMGKRGASEDTSYALRQISLLADQWNAEDKAVGRNPVLVVTKKRERAWSACDVL